MLMTMNEQSTMIDMVNREAHQFDEWQAKFMKGVTRMRDGGVTLTAKQQNCLTRIYDELVDKR
jgi:hypothetical protein